MHSAHTVADPTNNIYWRVPARPRGFERSTSCEGPQMLSLNVFKKYGEKSGLKHKQKP